MDTAIKRKLALAAGREALERGHELTLTTIGTSMLPLISQRDRITVIRCDAGELRCGNIIIYQGSEDETCLIAHRIVCVKKMKGRYHFVIKGDTRWRCDKSISRDAIVGKIVKIKKGEIVLFLEHGIGKIINVFFHILSVCGIMPLAFAVFFKVRRGLVRHG